MKKRKLLLPCLCVWATAIANNAPLLTAAHPNYHLSLPANPTTGFSWYIQSYDAHLLELSSHQYIPPNTKLVGAGGTDTWTFKATAAALKAPMVTEIHLIYARPWDIEHGTEKTIYVVTGDTPS